MDCVKKTVVFLLLYPVVTLAAVYGALYLGWWLLVPIVIVMVIALFAYSMEKPSASGILEKAKVMEGAILASAFFLVMLFGVPMLILWVLNWV